MLSLDADVLIQAHRFRFPIDVAPGFWESLEEAGEAGEILIIRDVEAEIIRGGDELAEWLEERKDLFNVDNRDVDTQLKMGELGAAVLERKPAYTDGARADFFDKADSWLVAHAAAHHHIVVTEEARAPDGYKKVKIPDACGLIGVECINTLQLVRQIGVKLVRG